MRPSIYERAYELVRERVMVESADLMRESWLRKSICFRPADLLLQGGLQWTLEFGGGSGRAGWARGLRAAVARAGRGLGAHIGSVADTGDLMCEQSAFLKF